MKKAAMCAAMILIAVSAYAQEKTRKVEPNLIVVLNSIENGVNKITSKENSIMSPGRWQAPAAIVNAAKERFEVQQVSVNTLRTIISRIRSEGLVSSARLFGVYTMVRDIEASVDDVGTLANAINPSSPVASDLMNLKGELVSQQSKLIDAVDDSIDLDSSDLAACSRPIAKKKK